LRWRDWLNALRFAGAVVVLVLAGWRLWSIGRRDLADRGISEGRRGLTGRWDFCSTCSRRWRALLSPLFQPIVSDCTHLVSIMVEIEVKISAAETPMEV